MSKYILPTKMPKKASSNALNCFTIVKDDILTLGTKAQWALVTRVFLNCFVRENEGRSDSD